MTDLRTTGRAGSLLIPIALIVAACGGATASGAPSGPTTSAAPVSQAPASQAPASQAPAASQGQPSAAPSLGGAIPSFDVGQLADGLANLDSYRVTISVNGAETYKGTVINKPVKARDLTVPGGTHIVTIGEDVWFGPAGGPLTAAPATIAQGLLQNFDIGRMVSAYSGVGWAESSIDKGTEQKNGVSAKHFRVDGTTVAAGFSGLPAGATLDVWIADAGYVVAVEATGFQGGDVSIQVTGVNDAANKIERPS